MPVSKKRKKKGVQRRRKTPSAQDVTFNNGKLSITATKYEQLKDNPDFIAAVRLGRVVNALSFSINLLKPEMTQASSNTETASGQRNHARILVMTAAYVKESLDVFYNLYSEYKDFEFFSPIGSILHPNDRSREKLLKTIRDGGAFHLDSYDKITATTLAKLDAEYYEVFSADTQDAFDFYFNMSDTVDLNYYLWSMNDQLSLDDKQAELYIAINQLARETFVAAHECLFGLLLKLPLNLKPKKMN